jgi:hypothetical protein
MHQSPQKHLDRRRDKQFEFELNQDQADRLRYRESQPKARKFHLEEEIRREQRSDKHSTER